MTASVMEAMVGGSSLFCGEGAGVVGCTGSAEGGEGQEA